MKIIKQDLEKIADQILNIMYYSSEYLFTSQIAKNITRDEEFVLKLLKNMEANRLVISINKNKNDKEFIRRRKWKINMDSFKDWRKDYAANKTQEDGERC